MRRQRRQKHLPLAGIVQVAATDHFRDMQAGTAAAAVGLEDVQARPLAALDHAPSRLAVSAERDALARAEGVHVGRRIHDPRELFGRHVAERAHDGRVHRRLRGARRAEVDDDDPAVATRASRPAVTSRYGSADAAERWLGPDATSAASYGSADAAEQWLQPTSGGRSSYGSADAAERWDAADLTERTLLANKAKYLATEVGLLVTSKVIQVVGGRGAYKDFPAERALRDVRTSTLMPPTVDRMLEAIGKHKLGIETTMFPLSG